MSNKALKIEGVRVNPGEYIGYVFRRYAMRYWWVAALPIVACLCLAAVNVNFLLVALMLAFVAVPLLLTMVYIKYGLTLESRWSILEKDMELCDNGIALTFEDEKLPHHLLKWEEFEGFRVNRKGIVLHFKKPFRYFMIPASSLADTASAQECITRINNHLHQL